MPSESELVHAAFTAFADEVGRRAPLYSRLSRAIALDHSICDLLLQAPAHQRRPVLLLAALHDIVLEHPELPLAGHYASVTPTPVLGDPMPAFTETVHMFRDRILDVMATRHTQTNEVGRCAPIVIALRGLGEAQPIGLVDVGCSAGLNLHLDRYGYRFAAEDGSSIVDVGEGTPLLECSVRGPLPIDAALPTVAHRIGLDAKPVDLADPAARRWLEACTWPDQIDRIERLRLAMAHAQQSTTDIITGDAVDLVGDMVATVDTSMLPVVLNSWVLAYLPPERRVDYRRQLESIGQRRDMTWIYLEAPSDCPELDGPRDPDLARLTAVMRIDWRSGSRTVRHVGTMHPHGYWIRMAAPHT